MKPGFLAPAGTLEKKPTHGAPCNRCGLCCQATLCIVAARVFKGVALPRGGHIAGPCPALSHDDTGSVCGLVSDPMKYAMRVCLEHGVDRAKESAKLLIGSATGCDARLGGEPINTEFYRQLETWDREHATALRGARKVWGIR